MAFSSRYYLWDSLQDCHSGVKCRGSAYTVDPDAVEMESAGADAGLRDCQG